MSAHLFFLLLNPAISVLLGAALAIIWMNRPSATYMRNAALALFAFAAAFVLQDIVPPAPFRLSSLFINLAFLATLTLLCIAVVQMAGGRPPFWSFGQIAGLTISAILWWLYGQESLVNRVHTMNLSHSLMALLTAIAAWRSPQRGWGRSLAIAAALVGLANFAWRPLLVLWEGNFYATGEDFLSSVYWNTTRLGSPVIAVFTVLSLMIGLSVALIHDLKLEARTDKLSGCLNRRGFEESCQAVLQHPERSKRLTTMIVADLDHFKTINDTFGHATGDLVIGAFGEALRQTMPHAAIIGRIGGEEFAVMLHGEDARNGHALIGACQESFARLQHSRALVAATASFGIYNCGHQDDLHMVLSRADKALYAAKRDGRNSVRSHNAPLTSVPAP